MSIKSFGARSSKPITVDYPVTILPQKKYESLLETLEILNNQKLLSEIRTALKEIRKGEVFTYEEVFGHPQPNLL